jgi:hypothetical protein
MFVKVFLNASLPSEDETGGSDASDSSVDISTVEQLIDSIPTDIKQIIIYFDID